MGICNSGSKSRKAVWHVLLLVLAVRAAVAADEGKPANRERVGESSGQPVYRDQIHSEQPETLPAEALRVFAGPAVKAYCEKHREEIEPTEDEIEFARKYFDEKYERETLTDGLRRQLDAARQRLSQESLSVEELKMAELNVEDVKARLKYPGRRFAVFMLDNWKFQKHLYDNHGGGRILFQQSGLEAFDAHRTWLDSMEKAGEFQITDPAIRQAFYRYWTTQNHGPFLTNDKQWIREQFLEPAWTKKPEKTPAE